MAWKHQTKRHSNAKKYGCAGGIYAKPKKRYKTPVMPVELPKYMINGKFYYRDVRLGEYRNVANPTDSIPIDDVGTTNDYKYQLEKPKPKLKPSNWGVSMSVKEIERELDKGMIFQGVVADILEKYGVYDKADIDEVLKHTSVEGVDKSFIYDQMKTRKEREEQKEQAKKTTDPETQDFARDKDGKISDTRLSAYGNQQLSMLQGAKLHFTDAVLEVKGDKLVNTKTGFVAEKIDNDRMVNKIIYKTIL